MTHFTTFARERFDRLVGQETAQELLLQAIKCDRIAPAYWFSGIHGIGRRVAAQAFVETLFSRNLPASSPARKSLSHRLQQGNHPDLLWIEPTYQHQGKLYTMAQAQQAGWQRRTPPQIRIEQIREIAQFVSNPPLEASRLVVVLENAETMAEAAGNALLKTLEEPQHATLILIAPPDSLMPTLVSRCAQIPFYRLDPHQLQQVLQSVGYGHILEDSAIAAMAAGSPGNAIAAWQQKQQISPELLSQATQILTGETSSLWQVLDLARTIDRELDPQAQSWLAEYLLSYYWQKLGTTPQFSLPSLEYLEQARHYLLKYVQPRLVWEVTLMAIAGYRG
jgi:DNA polymerase-3 subunit delta'